MFTVLRLHRLTKSKIPKTLLYNKREEASNIKFLLTKIDMHGPIKSFSQRITCICPTSFDHFLTHLDQMKLLTSIRMSFRGKKLKRNDVRHAQI